MILLKCVAAYEAAKKLKDTELDFSAAYALMMLMRELEPRAKAYMEGEMKLAKKYGKKDENGDVIFGDRGSFEFASPEASKAFMKERDGLAGYEVKDLKIEPFRIKPPEKITPAILEALDGFIIFEQTEAKEG